MLSSLFNWGSSSPSNEQPNQQQQQQQQQQQSSTSPPSPPPQSQQQPPSNPTSTSSNSDSDSPEFTLINPTTKHKLFLGGIAFLIFSLHSTRRAITRRTLASLPPFYTSAPYHRPPVNGGVEAFEALHLATINVLSAGMAMTGAVLAAFDVNGIEDMRGYVRRTTRGQNGVDGGEADREMEREVEEWARRVLGLDVKEGEKSDGQTQVKGG